VGAGRSVDDLEFYAYLCRVADWRLDWGRTHNDGRSEDDAEPMGDAPNVQVMHFYETETAQNLSLINATCLYRGGAPMEEDLGGNLGTQVGGILPACVIAAKLPSFVTTETKGNQH